MVNNRMPLTYLFSVIKKRSQVALQLVLG